MKDAETEEAYCFLTVRLNLREPITKKLQADMNILRTQPLCDRTRTFFSSYLTFFSQSIIIYNVIIPKGGTEMSSNISDSVIKRLPRYYRFLGELKASGMTRISSRELSERMGLTASQIRQDLNCFGGFGQQGYGYNIELLQSEIARILGIDAPKTRFL